MAEEHPMPILVVFDIDETLLQFMNGSAHHFLDEISAADRKTIKESNIEFIESKSQNPKTKKIINECILFRPHLRDFFEMVKANPRINIALWTYSERSYAKTIAAMITNHFGFERNPFVFMYGAEDVDDDTYPKSLTQIWRDFPMYNKFNTILVDDRLANISHEYNILNSIVCQGFAPFSEYKTRLPLTPKSLHASITDTMFLELMKIIKNSFKFIDGCSEEEYDDAFANENIFLKKIREKNGNDKYIQDVKGIVNGVEKTYNMMAIGDVSLAGVPHKGGNNYKKRRSMKKLYNNKKRRSMKKY